MKGSVNKYPRFIVQEKQSNSLVTTCKEIAKFATPPASSSNPQRATTTALDAFMTDLTTVLPAFPSHEHARLIPSLERNLVTTTDLITLDAVEIAKRAQLPLLDVKRLSKAVLEALQASLGVGEKRQEGAEASNVPLQQTGSDLVKRWQTFSTLNGRIDAALGGGIPTGYITEVTGER